MNSKVTSNSDCLGCIHDLELYYQNLKAKIAQKEKHLARQGTSLNENSKQNFGKKQLVPISQDRQEGSEATIVQLRLDAVHDLLLKIRHLHPTKTNDNQTYSSPNRGFQSSKILPEQYLDFLNYVPNLPINFPDYDKIQEISSSRDGISGDEEEYGRGATGRSSLNLTLTNRTADSKSMNSITSLINNFLEFIKTRCEIVYVEYDEYHKLLQDLVHLGQKDSRLKSKLDQIFLKGKEDLCGQLFDGEEVLKAFRGVVLKGVSDLSNLVDRRINERRKILLFRRKEIEQLHEEYSRLH